MIDFYLLMAMLFLPVFPLSMIFTQIIATRESWWLRSLLLLIWPQIGIFLLGQSSVDPSPVILYWAIFSSLLYAFRALVLRDMGLWIGFMAVSVWALLWLVAAHDDTNAPLHFYALGFSSTLVVLTLLAERLRQDFGAAYSGVIRGLGVTKPRYSGVLAVTLLALVATPPFPGFSAMLSVLHMALRVAPVMLIMVAAVWLLWSWAGARLLQDLIAGEAQGGSGADIDRTSTWVAGIFLAGLVVGGVYLLRGFA